MLEYTEAARPHIEKIEELPGYALIKKAPTRAQQRMLGVEGTSMALHDDKINKVDTGRFVHEGLVTIGVNPVGEVAKTKPEYAERDTVAFEIPV